MILRSSWSCSFNTSLNHDTPKLCIPYSLDKLLTLVSLLLIFSIFSSLLCKKPAQPRGCRSGKTWIQFLALPYFPAHSEYSSLVLFIPCQCKYFGCFSFSQLSQLYQDWISLRSFPVSFLVPIYSRFFFNFFFFFFFAGGLPQINVSHTYNGI